MKKIGSLMILLVIAMLSFGAGTYNVQPPGNEIVVTLNADVVDHSFGNMIMVDNQFIAVSDAETANPYFGIDIPPGNVQEVAINLQTYYNKLKRYASNCNYSIATKEIIPNYINCAIFVKYRNNIF